MKCCLNIFPHIYKYDNYNYIIYSIIIMELMKVYSSPAHIVWFKIFEIYVDIMRIWIRHF